MERKDSQSNIRLYVLGSLLALALVVYIGVLYDIQINQHDYYLARSIRTITQEETVEASRGVITDRSGREMVSSRSSYNLTFDSSALDEGEDENEAILRLVKLCQSQGVAWVDNLPITKTAPFSYTFTSLTELNETQRNRFTAFLRDQLEVVPEDTTAEDITADCLSSLGLSAHAMVERLRQEFKVPVAFSLNEARSVIGVQYELSIRKLMNTTAYAMVEDIDTQMISLLNDGDYDGAKITASSVREYKTTNAAHILGTVTPIWAEEYDALKEQGYSGNDRIGRSGVEAAFEQYLRGTDGKRIVSTNAAGKITGEYYEKAPQPGNTVELTIDLSLQQAVESALAEAVADMNAEDGDETRGAGAAVIQVGTGEVLALASYPTYDPAAYNRDYNSLLANPANPLLNRATQGAYVPASTLKPLVAVAALETGATTPSEKIKDTGKWYYPGDPNSWLWCWNHSGHGRVNATTAITNSCNYYFATMGYRMGMDTLREYLTAFGLGQSTGIEIGDRAGTLPENPPGENQAPWAAFGQGNQLYTPLQLANYVATLVSGGKHCQPHLLKAVKSYDNTQILAVGDSTPTNVVEMKDSTLQAVKEGMLGYTQPGGQVYSYFKDCVVTAGAKTGTAQLGGGTTNNGVFVCFAPYDDPQIAVSIVIEHGNAGAALASTAVKILNAYFTADEIGTAIVGENQLLQ
ncbi:penicillin-binding transpeptidase domain-containing protein [uncultured Oscillibacter sp.]|uniref:penicillin-binding transpeptidase domain-containing protein n=1 Tax=uncultured Oscillibacter sp. TaxID=876091 RepID=UPI00280BDC75|nr:penicillin-binding transpeptidase domain-containing protein [uncultured Oscillibacter sp.]